MTEHRLLLLILCLYCSCVAGFLPPCRSAAVLPKPSNEVLLMAASQDELEDRTSGILVLLSVPLAWGTYSPVVKYLYQVEPAIPGIVFSAAYYMVASILLHSLLLKVGESSPPEETDFPIQGGLELGLYLFIANLLQVSGLETVPSDRAGFLVQLTTVMVPLMQAGINKTLVPLGTWIACILAFCGVIVMGMDGDMTSLATNLGADALSKGDVLIVSAAVLYSLHVVRLGAYAKQSSPLQLAASKATTEAFLSIGTVSTLLYIHEDKMMTFITDLTTGWASGTVTLESLTPALSAVLWTGFVTCAYTIYAQSYGQARVSPVSANLMYTSQPLFTALFGYLLLGETLGPSGIVGATLIGAAVYAVTAQDIADDDDKGVLEP